MAKLRKFRRSGRARAVGPQGNRAEEEKLTPDQYLRVDVEALLRSQLPITIEEAAATFRVSKIHVYRRIQAREIPAIKIGHRLLIPHFWFKAKLTGEPIAQP